eukprot:GHVP01024989.1.p1 GENE.GHVP01024989.1~~GHVP01024989.1.p1  ORF type:complete len:646 (-),score=105.04 GHVP01024989.1:3039-4847(-)
MTKKERKIELLKKTKDRKIMKSYSRDLSIIQGSLGDISKGLEILEESIERNNKKNKRIYMKLIKEDILDNLQINISRSDCVLFMFCIENDKITINEDLIKIIYLFGIKNIVSCIVVSNKKNNRNRSKNEVKDTISKYFPDSNDVFYLELNDDLNSTGLNSGFHSNGLNSCFHSNGRNKKTTNNTEPNNIPMETRKEQKEVREMINTLYNRDLIEENWKVGRLLIKTERIERVDEKTVMVEGVYNGGYLNSSRLVYSCGIGVFYIKESINEDGTYIPERIDIANGDSNDIDMTETVGHSGIAEMMEDKDGQSDDYETSQSEDDEAAEDAEDDTMRAYMQGYRGVDDFRTLEWTEDETLRDSQLLEFPGYFWSHNKNRRIMKRRSQLTKLKIEGEKDDIDRLYENQRNVLIGLFDKEDKRSIGYYKIHIEDQNQINTGDEVIIFTGIRWIKSKVVVCKKITDRVFLLIENSNIREDVYISLESPIQQGGNISIFSNDGRIQLIAKGMIDTFGIDKILLEKKTISGKPNKPSGRSVIVKGMFSNPGDVKHFKNIGLITKGGVRGHIKESIGTHGRMKCFFGRKLTENDTVQMNLYKRVFPLGPWI